jgi:hypothetical protein
VHQRYVLMHMVEQSLVGLAMGALMGIPLVAALLWRGLETELVAISLPALGLLLGAVHGFATRPTRMQAATEADRQLGLADLLGSALSVSDRADWAAIIRSQADATCQRISPTEVVLHRLGVRVWGGAGLASALLIALAFLPTSAAPSQGSQNSASAYPESQVELARAASLPRPTAIQADPDSSERSRFGELKTSAASDAVSTSNELSHDLSAGSSPANGQGAASAAADPRPLQLGSSHSADIGDGHHTATGAGNQSGRGTRADSADSGSAGTTPDSSDPPWKSSAWPAKVNQVQAELQSGHIPDAYRDMIGGYFQPR